MGEAPRASLEIGRAFGPMLRINSYTASSSRGSYAHLCLQINLMKPLINTIKVGRLRQKVMYEGISSPCFCYGKLGHKKESCYYHICPLEKNVEEDPTSSAPDTQAK